MSFQSIWAILLSVLLFLAGFIFWASRGGFPDKDSLIYQKISGVKSTHDSLSAKKNSFRLMTYNMGYASGKANNEYPISKDQTESNLKLMKEFVARSNLDFLLLQEVDFKAKRSGDIDQAIYLASEQFPEILSGINWDKNYLPFPYWPIKNQYGRILSGQATLSKFPITDRTRFVFDKPSENWWGYNLFYIDRLALISKVQVGKKKLVLVNIHLEAFAEKTREEQSQVLKKLITPYLDLPLIVAGDWNASHQIGVVKQFIDEKILFESSQVAGVPSPKTYPSWNAVENIDHILFNSHLRLKQFEPAQVPGNPSDHHPVIAEFEWVEK